MEHTLRPTARLGALADRAPKPPTLRQQFHDLRQALTEGWEIVQPIFARPLWSALDDETTAFHFVLQRERATRLLTVTESRSVRRFIRQKDLKVQEK